MRVSVLVGVVMAALGPGVMAFAPSSSGRPSGVTTSRFSSSSSSSPSSSQLWSSTNDAAASASASSPPTSFFETIEGVEASDEWELDCYSRPVLVNGKKLWEVLLTDSSGSFRLCETLPSNKVNSRELRRIVEDTIDNADVKPNVIRFFRGAMFNMITIALGDVEVVTRPSRCTFELAKWLDERNTNVYPKMEGYKPNMSSAAGPAFMGSMSPRKLPDSLRGEKYAFVSLPLSEFLEGGGVNKDNVGVGRLCPVDPNLPADTFVSGVVLLTDRAGALASWLAGTEVSAFTADLRKRNLVMEADIDTRYLVAKLDDVQRAEGTAFEEGKDQLNGLHFISVQRDEDDDPAGFWLLQQINDGL
uniref:Uncharacterized protein n=1 Tax=Attheya septentrionalis TaxID=420275 RepID=A0A7S2UGL6_9STRA|mmetsp:Transcript_2162/g.3935  ORF Transcript_2162/g.3935 Transcript_2162/m.3935 type:complete len:360 (+) Transcript_2162:149-1228(+)|eukprot:CAMPEP_0198305880 /NCGR_PEP_ID=MMETSP1449-20131203/58130_1 /TAXON_ID=420275 /ORGANISM="Attheya septentrionalis, Strain CCMP2084" /LENGTH=359 /DNA_ID=CAMNT_0044008423 /DNA_START=91 /DNA_END=1170 /DNA_ORIENTATION=-